MIMCEVSLYCRSSTSIAERRILAILAILRCHVICEIPQHGKDAFALALIIAAERRDMPIEVLVPLRTLRQQTDYMCAPVH